MAGRDHRSRTMLSTASVIRWTGRRVWRWFFAILFLAAVALNVATVASHTTFNGVSDLVGAVWTDTELVRDDLAVEIAEERSERMAAVEAEAEARAALEQAEGRAAELAQRLEAAETELADAEALAEARLARLAAASRRWIDLSRENARLQAEAEAAATEAAVGEETAPEP